MNLFQRAFTLLLLGSPLAYAGGNTVKTGKVHYSDLKYDSDCRSDGEDGGDSWGMICKGFKGYTPLVFGTAGPDMMMEMMTNDRQPHSYLDLKVPGGKVVSFNEAMSKHARKGGAINITGKKIEWRYTKDGKKTTPYALIFRVYTEKKSKLFVARLNGPKTCLIGTTAKNEVARQIADDLSRPCIK